MVDDSGTLVGFWPDLSAEIAERLGLKLNLVKIDWAGLLPGVTAGTFDLGDGVLTQSPERLASPDIRLSKPYLTSGTTAVVLKSSGITDWVDLAGKRIGQIPGEAEPVAVQTYLSNHGWDKGTLVDFPGSLEAVLGLMQDRADAYATWGAGAAYLIKESPQGADLAMLPQFDPVTLGTAYNPAATGLGDAIDKIISEMLADGTIDRVTEKWFGTTELVYRGG